MDVGKSYLEAKTNKNVYFIAGPAFKDREGHFMVRYMALYGLRTSGLSWHERFAELLQYKRFTMFKAELTNGLRNVRKSTAMLPFCVDDLVFAMDQSLTSMN